MSRRMMTKRALHAAIAAGMITVSADAAYIYNTTSGTASENWSSGTGWNTAPVSGTDTQLTFIGVNSTVFTAGSTPISNNDNAAFTLNILDLQGTGPASGTAPTLAVQGNALTLVASSVAANPAINLNALKGTSGLNYNVKNNLALGNNLAIAGNGTAAFTLSGNISGSAGITKSGSSGVTLSGNNNYVGPVAINGGTLRAYSNSALGSSSNAVSIASGAVLAVNENRAIGNAMGVNGGTITFAPGGGSNTSLNGLVTLGANSAVGASAQSTGSQLTFAGGVALGGNTLTFRPGYFINFITTVSSDITGTGGAVTLEKDGSTTGSVLTVNLNGTNTYTGATTVRDAVARLYINGSVTSNVVVNAGRLGGSGSVNATNSVTIGNSSGSGDAWLTPGGSTTGLNTVNNSIATLQTGALTLNSDARYEVQINRTLLLSDNVNVTGGISINPAAQLVVTDLGTTSNLAASTRFTILQSSGAITGTFAGLPQGSSLAVGGNTFYINYQPSQVQLWTVAIPEPATVSAAGLVAILCMRRRAR